jgi:hypothetical protein
MSRIVIVLSPVSQWPSWVQALVFGPNAILMAILTYWWWPNTSKEWRRFGIALAYLIAFYLVIYFVFGF